MKKLILPALAASLALGACDSAPDNDAADAAVTDGTADTSAGAGDTTIVTPTATETVVTEAETGTTADGGDQVSIGPDGVKADVGDADTRIQVDTNGKTVTVKD